MTMGPAPMIRIDLMSVRLGIGLRAHKKRARLLRVLRPRRRVSSARGGSLDQNRGGWKGCLWRARRRFFQPNQGVFSTNPAYEQGATSTVTWLKPGRPANLLL